MKAVKFDFGDDFDTQSLDQAELEALALEERLRKTEESAFRKGMASGKAEASEAIAKELVAVMDRVADQVNTLFGQRIQLQDRLERDATQLALAMARKLAATALEMHPHAEIEALITECMEACREQPKIVVRLSQKQCEPLAEKIEELKQRKNFTGEVIVIGDDEIRDGDCLVEWPDGGAERRSAQVSDAIEKLVQSFIMKPPVTETAQQIVADSENLESEDPDSEITDAQPAQEMQEKASEQSGSSTRTDEEAPTLEQPGAP